MLPPLGSVTMSAMLPPARSEERREGKDGITAETTLPPVRLAGKVSTTVAPVAVLGPRLLTVTVYVIAVPGTAPPGWLSVFVTLRSAVGVSGSVSVTVLFDGVGSVTPAGAVIVAVFDRVPVAVGLMVALIV